MEIRESQNVQLELKKSQHLFALVTWKLLGSIKQALSVYAGQSRSLKVFVGTSAGSKTRKRCRKLHGFLTLVNSK